MAELLNIYFSFKMNKIICKCSVPKKSLQPHQCSSLTLLSYQTSKFTRMATPTCKNQF